MASYGQKRSIPFTTIKGVTYSIESDNDRKRSASTEVNNTSSNISNPEPGSMYTPLLGASSGRMCTYCGNRDNTTCTGHIGYTSLKYPALLPITKNVIIQFAKVVCLECGSFMIKEKDRISGDIPKENLLSLYVALTRNKKKKNTVSGKQVKVNMICPKCKAIHPHVFDDKVYNKKKDGKIAIGQTIYDANGREKTTRLWNSDLLKAFRRVSDETVRLVGKPISSHPKNLLCAIGACPPITIRPTKRIGAKSSADDLSILYKGVMDANANLPDAIPEVIDRELGEKYMNLANAYYNLHMSSVDANTTQRHQIISKNKQGITDRFAGKKGLLRNDLMGSRCFNMGRSVISGDPRIPPSCLGVPLSMCRTMYKEMTVTANNYDEAMMYFQNGLHTYPGCIAIKQRDSGKLHAIEWLRPDTVLKIGDKVLRNIIDGDTTVFGRQPSLWELSIRAHKAKVIYNGDSIRINPLVCYGYNADFDGDECNITGTREEQNKIEIEVLASIENTGTKVQDGGNVFGQFQNSMWGIAHITQSHVKMRREIAMQCLGSIDDQIQLDEGKDIYTGREVVSKLLPDEVNYKATAFLYNPDLPIDYAEEDVNVVIENGQLISGVLDKNSVGQGKRGTLQHNMTVNIGADRSQKTNFHMQQIADSWLDLYGGTFDLSDIYTDDQTSIAIKEAKEAVVRKYKQYHDDFIHGRIYVPPDVDRKKFYEEAQINNLNVSGVLEIIHRYKKLKEGGFDHLVSRCGKGKNGNKISTLACVGQQIINGGRIYPNEVRPLPYFPAYSDDPGAHGFIHSSLTESMTLSENISMAMVTRVNLTHRQLSTAITGAGNRTSNKNMESVITNHHHMVMREDKYIVQPIYGGLGIETKKTIHVKIPYIKMSDDEFEKNYKSDVGDDKGAQIYIAREFDRLRQDREYMRRRLITLKATRISDDPLDDIITSAFDISSIIMTTVNKYKSSSDKSRNIDYGEAVSCVEDFCDSLAYIYMNRYCKARGDAIPVQYDEASSDHKIIIRAYLCTAQMKINDIDMTILRECLDKIYMIYKTSIIGPGICVGLHGSLSMWEQYTQFMLDAHLLVGLTGGGSFDKMRGIELMMARDTDSMRDPQMLVKLNRDLECNERNAIILAHEIEMVSLGDLIYGKESIFIGERIGKNKHRLMGDQIEAYNHLKSINANDLNNKDQSDWTIRYDIDIDKMMAINMSMFEIVNALKNKIRDIGFVLNSSEIAETPFITVYIYKSYFDKSKDHVKSVVDINNVIMSTIVHGVDKIKSATVVPYDSPSVDENGSITTKKAYGVLTKGVNMEEMFLIDWVDNSRLLTSSIHDMQKYFGILAARRSIVSEMSRTFKGPARAHYMIFASEMTSTGEVTGITKGGAQRRHNNFLTRISHAHAIQNIAKSAIDGSYTDLNSPSASMIVGQPVKCMGKYYGDVIVNNRIIRERSKNVVDML